MSAGRERGQAILCFILPRLLAAGAGSPGHAAMTCASAPQCSRCSRTLAACASDISHVLTSFVVYDGLVHDSCFEPSAGCSGPEAQECEAAIFFSIWGWGCGGGSFHTRKVDCGSCMSCLGSTDERCKRSLAGSSIAGFSKGSHDLFSESAAAARAVCR